jgi:hypothetical protein
VWHAVGEQGVPTRAIATVIGRHLGIPVVSVSPQDAGTHFGWMGLFWSANLPTSSAVTQEKLGWHPVGPGLIEDLEEGHYFSTP